jgi:hypothetical protein
LAFALWNPRSCWWHCLAGWLVATKEEKLKLHLRDEEREQKL